MSDQRPTYEGLGLIPTLHTQASPAPTSRPSIQIRIHRKEPLTSPRPEKAVKPTPKPARSFHMFLELPLEIRRLIYQFSFTANSGVIGSRHLRLREDHHPAYHRNHDDEDDTVWREDRRNRRSPMAVGLLQANHQVYHESIEYLYRTPNTIILTTPNMLERFTTMPHPLSGCVTKNCEPHQQKPLISRGIFYPKEMDLALEDETVNMIYMEDYLPPISDQGGITFDHLTIDISCGTDLRPFHRSLPFSGITVNSTFTIRGWGFERFVRIWIKSRDCARVIEHFNLHKTPTFISELPSADSATQNLIPGYCHLPWSVTWSSARLLRPGDHGEPSSKSSLGLGEWTDQGQCKIRYEELEAYDVPRDMLDMSEVFPGVAVKRYEVQPKANHGWVGGTRVLGEN